MINSIVRLLDISINNFKNVEYGTIKFNSYVNAKKNFNLKKGDLLGVYGQNGSGKTALIEAIDILRILLSGGRLPEDIRALIARGQEVCRLEATCYIELGDYKCLAYYEVDLCKTDNSIMVSSEKLSCSISNSGKWTVKSRLIDYHYTEEDFFKPAFRYKEIVCKDKEAPLMLRVAKELSKKNKTSFIFSDETKSVLKSGLEENHETIRIIESLDYFSRFSLCVITNKQLGLINASQLLPIEDIGRSISENFTINIFAPFMIPERLYKAFAYSMEQMSIVLTTILPGLNLELFKRDRHYLNTGEVGIRVELLSVREGMRIPLGSEAEGVKKIIWILTSIITMYNEPSACIAIDNMDSGIFEHLFGEMLEVLQSGAQGQLIFTAHNLRGLEKLNKESIIVTTTNPNNRYIRLVNVKNNDNLRDFYLRALALGGQKEVLCKEISSFEMQYALRRAGEVQGKSGI